MCFLLAMLPPLMNRSNAGSGRGAVRHFCDTLDEPVTIQSVLMIFDLCLRRSGCMCCHPVCILKFLVRISQQILISDLQMLSQQYYKYED